jgi:hypothetical protein
VVVVEQAHSSKWESICLLRRDDLCMCAFDRPYDIVDSIARNMLLPRREFISDQSGMNRNVHFVNASTIVARRDKAIRTAHSEFDTL